MDGFTPARIRISGTGHLSVLGNEDIQMYAILEMN